MDWPLFILLRKFSYKCKSHKLLLVLSRLLISEAVSQINMKKNHLMKEPN